MISVNDFHQNEANIIWKIIKRHSVISSSIWKILVFSACLQFKVNEHLLILKDAMWQIVQMTTISLCDLNKESWYMLWCTVCFPDLSHTLPYHLYALLHLSSLFSQDLQLVLGLLFSSRLAAGKFWFLAREFYCGMTLWAFWSLWVVWGSSRAIVCLSVAEQSSCSILISSVLFVVFR